MYSPSFGSKQVKTQDDDRTMHNSHPNLSYTISTIIILFIFTQSVASSSSDTIIQTCRNCADKSTALNYDFCISTLQNRPTAADDVRGLAVSSMLQALDNATATISTIRNLMDDEASQFDTFSQSCLRDCLELYSDGADSVADAVRSFLQGRYDTVNVRLSAAMDAAVTCEEGFGEGSRSAAAASPLSGENYNLFQLSDVALCIVSMISSPSSSMGS